MWEKFAPRRIGHVIRRMRSGCRRIINGILWELSELITQERIAVGSSNLVDSGGVYIHEETKFGYFISKERS